MIVPVILSGGSGTRLWPLSSDRVPKQFLSLTSERSLLQDTILRLDSLSAPITEPIIVCNQAHGALILEQLALIERSASHLVMEPKGRNTAPAATVAALLATNLWPNTELCLLILPADHVIGDPRSFAEAVAVAQHAASDSKLVTFGIPPDRPETGYGYIKRGSASGDVYSVDRFVEKPDEDGAREFLAAGDYYWNSGMFMFEAGTLLAEIGRFAPDILSACERAVATSVDDDVGTRLGRDAFLECPDDSIDYAVMERTRDAVMVPLEAEWSDVGSWSGLHDICDSDSAGNTKVGEVTARGCRNSYFRSSSRRIAAIGVEDLVVVETPDAVLVASRDRSQEVKGLAEKLSATQDSSGAASDAD